MITYKTIGNEKLIVHTRLNDECKNWFSEFAITGDLYENGRRSAWGCLHEKILEFFPEYKILVDLHISDCRGVPMYAIENGMYHFRDSIDKWVSYLRIERLDKDIIEKLRLLSILWDENQFYTVLKEKRVFIHWRNQARKWATLLWIETKWMNGRDLSKYKLVDVMEDKVILKVIEEKERDTTKQ